MRPKKKMVTEKRVEFYLMMAPGRTVFLAGQFNDWDPAKTPMLDKYAVGLYQAVISLPPGKHEYKFVVDGEWRVDPDCNEWVDNGHGSLNSLVRVLI